MDLKNFFSASIKQKEFYWSLVLEQGWIQAAIWAIDKENAKVVAVSSPTAWEAEENLVSAADTALSSAVQNLPEEIRVA